jgi:hypothetical protein
VAGTSQDQLLGLVAHLSITGKHRKIKKKKKKQANTASAKIDQMFVDHLPSARHSLRQWGHRQKSLLPSRRQVANKAVKDGFLAGM